MARSKRRGVSAGTIFMLSLSVLTLLFGGGLFLRISGDVGQISIDPNLLTEPLTSITRTIVSTNPESVPARTAPAGPENGASAALPTPPPTPTPSPTPPRTRKLSLTAVGQITLGTELRASGRSKTTGNYNYVSAFEPVAHALSGADLSIATLRTGLGEESAGFDTYRAPAALAESLKAAGVNLVNLATDRVLDHGAQGVSDTRAALQKVSLSSAGAYLTEEERQLLPIQEISGIKVGLVCYTGAISAAGKKAATKDEIAVATRSLDIAAASADIAALRQNGADIVVVLAHWGARSDTKPSRDTRLIAEALAQAGADIILGTNPTSVQEIERKTVRDPSGISRDVLIAYSLGNFLIDDSRDTPAITGLIVHMDLEWDVEARKASFTDVWYMPTWIMRWKDESGVNRYRVVPAGTGSIPPNMTDNIYLNMKKAYQGILGRIDAAVARPKPE